MTVCGYCSQDFDRLVERLIAGVAEARGGAQGSLVGAWSRPATVVVPSLDMGEFVRQTVARLEGVAINYRFSTLQKFLTEQIVEAAESSGEEFGILDREVLKTVLLECFQKPASLPEGVRRPIEDYIEAGGEAGGEQARERRRYQLARRLATTFEEYMFSRRQRLEAWEQGDTGDVEGDIGSWQAKLWKYLIDYATGGVVHGGKTYLPLTRAFDRVKGAIESALLEETTGGLHLFGFSGFGQSFLDMLTDFENLDVHFYFRSPTRDAKSTLIDGKPEHRALDLWGGVGRDTLAQLEDAVDEGLSELEAEESVPPEHEQSLYQLQSAIEVDGTAEGAGDGVDESLRFLNCPGVRREVEIVANEIWSLVGDDEDGSLRFSDIAVVLPENRADAYLAHVESVFDEFEDLPLTVNSMSLGNRSAVLDAVELLLELPLGDFRRRDLLALLVHPNFVSRYRNVDDADWMNWVDELNILYGADAEHQSENGHYLEKTDSNWDLFNWDQGMNRLALGAFLDVDDDGPGEPVEIGGRRYLPESLSMSEMPSASALNTAVTSLLDDARWLRNQNPERDEGDGYTLEQWAEILGEMVDTYIVGARVAGRDMGDDMADISRIKKALGELAELPDIGQVSYRTAHMYATDRLSKLQDSGNQKFSDGVVVSTPKRLRSIPFRHIFVVGAGVGDFPARDPRSELDIRIGEAEQGDVWPSQRDKYHFLEMLQSAGESLTVSWVGREPTTGEDVPPSSVVSDLARMAPIDFELDDDETRVDAMTEVHPLRRYDRDFYGFPVLSESISEDAKPKLCHPEAFEEARMRALRDAGIQVAKEGRTIWSAEALLKFQKWLRAEWFSDDSNENEKGSLAPSLRMIEPGDGEADDEDDDGVEEISIGKLSSFLKSPLQAKAKNVFGIYDDEDDTLTEERESFEFGNLDTHIIGTSAFEKMLRNDNYALTSEGDAEKAIREVIDEDFRPGELPAGVFSEVSFEDLIGKLTTIGFNAVECFDKHLILGLQDKYTRFEFGPGNASEHEQTQQVSVPPIEGKYRLTGRTPVLLDGSDCFFGVKFSTSSSNKFYYHNKAYLSHLALSAFVPGRADTRRKSVVVPANSKWTENSKKSTFKKRQFEFPALSEETATRALRELLNAFVDDGHIELFPINFAQEYFKKKKVFDRLEAWQYAMDEDEGKWSSLRTQYGPIADYLDYPPPEDPIETLRRRFRYHEKLGPKKREDG